MKTRRDVVYFCLTCGSLDVEAEYWVHLNKWEPRDASGDQWWCPRCQDHDRHGGIAEREDRGPNRPPIWTTDESEDFSSLRELIRNVRECGYRRPRAGTT